MAQARRRAAPKQELEEQNLSLIDKEGQDDAEGKIAEMAEDIDLPRSIVAEFIGSFFLSYLALGAVYGGAVVTFDVVTVDRQIYMALAYGLGYAAIVYGMSFPSQNKQLPRNTRHLNPAITMALFLAGKIYVARFLFYLMAQISGTALGVLCIYYTTPFNKRNITSAYPLIEDTNSAQLWWAETVLSYFSMLSIFLTSFRRNSPTPPLQSTLQEASPQTHHELNCLVSGLTVFASSAAGSPVSGGFINPLLALGVGILSGAYKMGPFVGPFVGAVLAVLTAHLFGLFAIQRRNLGAD